MFTHLALYGLNSFPHKLAGLNSLICISQVKVSAVLLIILWTCFFNIYEMLTFRLSFFLGKYLV